ncbi:hypothetical protein TWF694_005057 [Orbilia ellipsospora]|uniref:Uncharacterized protein n=1 Tax=Orbilia ellipsospora TaxID=2528407 RepID=A0AAV9WVR4_9PEZI
MALLLAPYNDSMRLGQGFNSYTHTLCIDKAVVVKDAVTVNASNPSQVVAYSSRFVEKLSEVVESMNVSYSSSIKKGTVEVGGNSSAVDESKFKESDLNVVISVKVVNQTTVLEDTAEFHGMDRVLPGTEKFDEIYGDSFISGFIEGGDLLGIVSMKVLDRSKVSNVSSEIKQGLNTAAGEKDWTLSTSAGQGFWKNSSASKDTETNISVNWMGGGQIKNPDQQWDMDSLFKAAAAFPEKVAKCPQRTWAILTKYKQNRSYVVWAEKKALEKSPLDYDNVISYTGLLFDNYMEYKTLLRRLRKVIQSKEDYVKCGGDDAIPVDIVSLIAVRSALNDEMSKIVSAVDALSRDPQCLYRHALRTNGPRMPFINRILQKAILGPNSVDSIKPSEISQQSTASVQGSKAASPSKGKSYSNIVKDNIDDKPAISESIAVENSAPMTTQVTNQKSRDFDFSQLVAPEIWAELMPIVKPSPPAQLSSKAGSKTARPPPSEADFHAAREKKAKSSAQSQQITRSLTNTSRLEQLDSSLQWKLSPGKASLLLGTSVGAYTGDNREELYTQASSGALIYSFRTGDDNSMWKHKYLDLNTRAKLGTPLTTCAFSGSGETALFYIGEDNKIQMIINDGENCVDTNLPFDDAVGPSSSLTAYSHTLGNVIFLFYENFEARISVWMITGQTIGVHNMKVKRNIFKKITHNVSPFGNCLSGSSILVFSHKSMRYILYQETSTVLRLGQWVIGDDYTLQLTLIEGVDFLSHIPLHPSRPTFMTCGGWITPENKGDPKTPSGLFKGELIISHNWDSLLTYTTLNESFDIKDVEGCCTHNINKGFEIGRSIGTSWNKRSFNALYYQNTKGEIETDVPFWEDTESKVFKIRSADSIVVGRSQIPKQDRDLCNRFKVECKLSRDILAISEPAAIRLSSGTFVFFVGSDHNLWYTYDNNDNKWLPGNGKFMSLGSPMLASKQPIVIGSINTDAIHLLAIGLNGCIFHLSLSGSHRENWRNGTWTEIKGDYIGEIKACGDADGYLHLVSLDKSPDIQYLFSDGIEWTRPSRQSFPYNIDIARVCPSIALDDSGSPVILAMSCNKSLYHSIKLDLQTRRFTFQGESIWISNIDIPPTILYPGLSSGKPGLVYIDNSDKATDSKRDGIGVSVFGGKMFSYASMTWDEKTVTVGARFPFGEDIVVLGVYTSYVVGTPGGSLLPRIYFTTQDGKIRCVNISKHSLVGNPEIVGWLN